MKRILMILSVILLLSLFVASIAVAQTQEPVGGCPEPFHLHTLGEHDEEHHGEHKHVGSDKDQNGDGWICVKHVETPKGETHVHIDNNVPLP